MLRKILFWTSKSGSCVTLVVLPIIVILEWSQAFTDCSKEAKNDLPTHTNLKITANFQSSLCTIKWEPWTSYQSFQYSRKKRINKTYFKLTLSLSNALEEFLVVVLFSGGMENKNWLCRCSSGASNKKINSHKQLYLEVTIVRLDHFYFAVFALQIHVLDSGPPKSYKYRPLFTANQSPLSKFQVIEWQTKTKGN